MAEGRRRYWTERMMAEHQVAHEAAAMSNPKSQAEADAEFLVDWLKKNARWANDGPLMASDATNRRYLQAFRAMSEDDWRLFVVSSLLRRTPMLPPLPLIERKAA